MPTEAQLQDLTIEKLVYGGDGLARLDGRVVLTPFVLPGEAVRAEVSRAKNDLLRGRLVEVVSGAPARVEPRCPYFYRCGGCQYQHAAYATQLEQKVLILREVLRRVGKIDYQDEIGVVSGEPWHYRNRTQLHIRNGAIGYFAAGSRELCAIDHCPISSPKLNEAIAWLSRELLSQELPSYRPFTAGVELFTNETELQINVLDQVPASVMVGLRNLGTSGPIEYGSFRVSRNSFFQVNRFLVDTLVEAAIGNATGETAIDLYAGVGLFAGRLAQGFHDVVAVEPGRSAFGDLVFNMDRAGLRVAAEQKTAEEYLAGLEETPAWIVADPLRAGLGKSVVAELLRLQAPHVTIVSCDPATLARDLAPLLAGAYRIEGITLVDLFPQTFHMETVVRLRSCGALEERT